MRSGLERLALRVPWDAAAPAPAGAWPSGAATSAHKKGREGPPLSAFGQGGSVRRQPLTQSPKLSVFFSSPSAYPAS